MAITYTWKIVGLKTQDFNDTYKGAIVQTYWEKYGTDENGTTGMFAGATPFTVDPTDNSGPFIPFDQLKETDVLDWIKSIVVGDYEAHVNKKIQEDIDDKNKIIVDVDMPWVVV